MTQKRTCGPIYLEALTQYTGGDPEQVRLFAAGFVHGQAEKVYLGACRAAMFRPSPERRALVGELASDAAQRYGLRLTFLAAEGEFWLFRDDAMAVWAEDHLQRMEPNSPEWHGWRGWFCGVPGSEIDPRFHERKGYGEPCDLPAPTNPRPDALEAAEARHSPAQGHFEEERSEMG